MSGSSPVLAHPLRDAGPFAAGSMASVRRLICHFLIVWLALLSGGAHAHAAADAAQELGHMAAHALEAQLAGASGLEPSGVSHQHEHSESCSLSHCGHGHATGLPPATHPGLSDAPASAPLPTLQAWASREQPNTIERPKWGFTTPAVVNL